MCEIFDFSLALFDFPLARIKNAQTRNRTHDLRTTQTSTQCPRQLSHKSLLRRWPNTIYIVSSSLPNMFSYSCNNRPALQSSDVSYIYLGLCSITVFTDTCIPIPADWYPCIHWAVLATVIANLLVYMLPPHVIGMSFLCLARECTYGKAEEEPPP